MRAELYIDVGRQSENKRIFERLRAEADQFERTLELPISWERLDDRRASRLAVYASTPSASFDEDAELVEWAAQAMAKLVDVFKPIVRTL